MDKYEKIALKQKREIKKENRILLISVSAILVAIVLLLFFSWKDVSYNRKFNAAVLRRNLIDDTYEMLGTVEVTVKGEYDFDFSQGGTADGVAVVDGVEYEYGGRYSKPYKLFFKYGSLGNAYRDEAGEWNTGDFHAAVNGRSAREMVIKIDGFSFKGYTNGENGEILYIVCGAEDLEKAEDIIYKLYNQDSFFRKMAD